MNYFAHYELLANPNTSDPLSEGVFYDGFTFSSGVEYTLSGTITVGPEPMTKIFFRLADNYFTQNTQDNDVPCNTSFNAISSTRLKTLRSPGMAHLEVRQQSRQFIPTLLFLKTALVTKPLEAIFPRPALVRGRRKQV